MSSEPETKSSSNNQKFEALLTAVNLEDVQKSALRARWLDQIQWLTGRARHARRWYYFLRLCAIIGALLIPALASFGEVRRVRYATIALGLIVAIAGAVEGFFRYGERWRHYRHNAEVLKSEGWQFLQLIGTYSKEQFATHAQAYDKFAGRVEEVLQQEVGVYIMKMATDNQNKDNSAGSAFAPPAGQ